MIWSGPLGLVKDPIERDPLTHAVERWLLFEPLPVQDRTVACREVGMAAPMPRHDEFRPTRIVQVNTGAVTP